MVVDLAPLKTFKKGWRTMPQTDGPRPAKWDPSGLRLSERVDKPYILSIHEGFCSFRNQAYKISLE